MRTLFPRVAGLFLTCLCFALHASAQDPRLAAREAEWNSYKLPSTNFVRKLEPVGPVLFRVPADWKPAESRGATPQQVSYSFTGPDAATLNVSIDQVADGLPLRDYLGAIMGQLRNAPGISESLIVRRTQMSGLEAREIMFELPDESGKTTRRFIWCTVSGPTAIAIGFIEPNQAGALVQPFLRAVVQSLVILDKDKYPAFEALRSAALKETKPARVDEVQSIADAVDGLDVSERSTAIARLAAIFSAGPDTQALIVNVLPRHSDPKEAITLPVKEPEFTSFLQPTKEIRSDDKDVLRNWPAALNAANTAIELNNKDADAHYELACVLARMGRKKEAMVSLKKAIELVPDLAANIGGEQDLKSLETDPEFKKLIAERDKQ